MQSIDLDHLVQPDRVHKSVYTDQQLFDLEMAHIFEKAWVYCGHESQVKEVGDYFNKNFICLKMDMEEEEGVNTASIYAIEAYPTYLFIDFKGDVKHRDLGYIDSESFIAVGKMALAKK